MPQNFTKDPSAILDYQINWATWLSTDTISTSSWTVTTGITLHATSKTTTSSTIWLKNGTSGTVYDVTNTIVTAGGRTDERTISILVENK